MVVPHKIVMGNLNRMMMRNRVIIYHQLATKFMEKKKKMKIMKSSQVMILQITNIHMNIRIIVLLGHIYLTAMSFTNSDKVL